MDVEGSWIRPAVVGNPEDEGSWGHWRRATKRKVKKRRAKEKYGDEIKPGTFKG